MKKKSILSLCLLIIASISYAKDAKEHYRHMIGTSAFTANNLYLKSGWYEMNDKGTGDNPELTNSNFVGSYYFGNRGDIWRPFILGGFGFSKIEQNPSTLYGSKGDIDLDSIYIKLGGGINLNPTQNIGLVLGASAMKMKTDARYNGSNNQMKHYFDNDSDTSLYDIFSTLNLHTTTINGYKPYFEWTLHYLYFDYDFDLSNTHGWNSDLCAGFYTPALTYWMDLPVRAKFFTAANILDSDLSDITYFKYAYHLGTSLLWKIGPMINLFDGAFNDTELAINLQGTHGNNGLNGWKASIGFSIAKF